MSINRNFEENNIGDFSLAVSRSLGFWLQYVQAAQDRAAQAKRDQNQMAFQREMANLEMGQQRLYKTIEIARGMGFQNLPEEQQQYLESHGWKLPTSGEMHKNNADDILKTWNSLVIIDPDTGEPVKNQAAEDLFAADLSDKGDEHTGGVLQPYVNAVKDPRFARDAAAEGRNEVIDFWRTQNSLQNDYTQAQIRNANRQGTEKDNRENPTDIRVRLSDSKNLVGDYSADALKEQPEIERYIKRASNAFKDINSQVDSGMRNFKKAIEPPNNITPQNEYLYETQPDFFRQRVPDESWINSFTYPWSDEKIIKPDMKSIALTPGTPEWHEAMSKFRSQYVKPEWIKEQSRRADLYRWLMSKKQANTNLINENLEISRKSAMDKNINMQEVPSRFKPYTPMSADPSYESYMDIYNSLQQYDDPTGTGTYTSNDQASINMRDLYDAANRALGGDPMRVQNAVFAARNLINGPARVS